MFIGGVVFENKYLQLFLVVAVSVSQKEICGDWEWLEKNMMSTLANFDDEDQITDFVRCKIESLVAHSQPSATADGISSFTIKCK